MNMNFNTFNHSSSSDLRVPSSSSMLYQHETLDLRKLTASGFGHGYHVPDCERLDTDIEATDVLCGRGKVSFNHVGNRRFRDLIAASTDKYNNAKSRLEKSMVVHSIVEEVKKVNGRFLKQDRHTGQWYELDERQAKEKVGHAIRDATSSIDPSKKKTGVKKTLSKSSSSKSSPSTDKANDVVRTISVSEDNSSKSSHHRLSVSTPPPPPSSMQRQVTPNDSNNEPAATTSSSSWWAELDFEPLHVDSLEAKNSLAELQTNDFFLCQMKSILDTSASRSNSLSLVSSAASAYVEQHEEQEDLQPLQLESDLFAPLRLEIS